MGMIIGKFRRKKSNSDLLDKIDKEITSIENFQRNTEHQRKQIVGKFLVGSVGIYVLSAILFYFYFYPQNFKERLLYLVPFCLAPTFIFLMKRSLSWYFNRKINKNKRKLVDLHAEKKKILENIMETETYKVARGLLEKYAPEQVRRVYVGQDVTPMKNVSVTAVTPSTQSSLRNRIQPNQVALKSNITQTPGASVRAPLGTSQMAVTSMINSPTPYNRNMLMVTTPGGRAPPTAMTMTPMPKYLPAKQRTFLDKMVDYVIGDGPNNRYALICKQCAGHNGMALMDEFEYVTFKCCYCMAMNPARKTRPTAPKLLGESADLPQLPALPPAADADAPSADDAGDTSDSEKNSGSDSDGGGVVALKESPTLETLYRKQLHHVAVGADDATVSSDNEPNDFDKLSDLESHDAEVEAKEEELTAVGGATQTIDGKA